MRYLFFIATDPEPDPDPVEPSPVQWVEEMTARSLRVDGERVHNPDQTITVRRRGGELLVTDGPFAETKEWMAGFDVMECPSLDVAIEAASKHPMAHNGRIEIRPFFPEDPAVPSVFHALPWPHHEGLYVMLLSTDALAEPYRAEEDTVAKWVADMDRQGTLLIGQLLRPVEDATLVRVRRGKLLVTDGPFAETKEWITGFGILACRNRNEAVEVASSHPAARFGRVELRRLWPFV
jgi:hypothetical protein